MIPINNSERRSAFFIFLVFFIVTTGIIVLTTFYGMQVPTKQNDQMKQEIDDYQKEQIFLQNFADKLSDTRVLLDKINLPNTDPSTEGAIKTNLDALSNQIGNDTTLHRKLYHDIVSSLNALDLAKKQIRENGSNDQQVSKLQQELNEKERDLDQCRVNVAQLEKSVH
jgi:hypothetical protein